jgi:hypothetical protein
MSSSDLPSFQAGPARAERSGASQLAFDRLSGFGLIAVEI